MIQINNLLSVIVSGIIVFIVTILVYCFTPLGLGFIVFSIVRGITVSETLKKVSFIFQIIIAALTLFIGSILSIILLFSGYFGYYYGQFIMPLSLLFAVLFIVVFEVVIIIWQSIKK